MKRVSQSVSDNDKSWGIYYYLYGISTYLIVLNGKEDKAVRVGLEQRLFRKITVLFLEFVRRLDNLLDGCFEILLEFG